MNKHQKSLLTNLITVTVVTIAFVTAVTCFKDFVNKSEAERSMNLIAREILKYRSRFGSLPSEQYLENIKKQIVAARLGKLFYRAQWISFDDDPANTVLAYTETRRSMILKNNNLVLWLDGTVEWVAEKHFEQILTSLQKQAEIDYFKHHFETQESPTPTPEFEIY